MGISEFSSHELAPGKSGIGQQELLKTRHRPPVLACIDKALSQLKQHLRCQSGARKGAVKRLERVEAVAVVPLSDETGSPTETRFLIS